MESTHRVIDGTLYARSPQPTSFSLRLLDLGNRHLEASALPCFTWHEVAALSPGAQADYLACLAEPPALTERELLDKACANKERATRRARTKVRRLAKFKGLETLLTLTYRENMVDRARMARDLDVFLKRVRRLLPHFEYICVFERQKRGAWHAHLAVRKIQSHYMAKGQLVKSYDLLRSMWRGVVGLDNGNVDVSRNKRVQRSAAKLAAYLSKYIGKTFDQAEKHVNSYSSSGRDLPDAIIERIMTSDQAVAVKALAELVMQDVLEGGCEVYQAFLDGGGYYLCLSPPEAAR
jgi:hypothetical protein